MDLYKAIRTLYEEKDRLDRLIQSLEQLQARGETNPHPPMRARRGRKKMTAAERQEVSARMKKYWASRREHSPAGATEVAAAAGASL